MDRSTFSKWGSLVCVVLVVAIMVSFATPFGKFVTTGVQTVLSNFGDTTNNALEYDGKPHQTIEGNGQDYSSEAPAALTFRSPAPLSEFQSLKINGEVVDSSNYTLTEGSTIVTLPVSYLSTLAQGSYEVAIVSENMVAKGRFTIDAPDSEPDEECTHANVTHTYDWASVNAYHSVTCLDCGNVANEDCYAYSYSSINEHDCITMCICGNTIGDQSHNFSAGVCIYCGYDTTGGCTHKNLTYTPDYSAYHSTTCSDCGIVIEDQVICTADHYDYYDENGCYPMCVCGFAVSSAEEHNVVDGACTNCGETIASCAHENREYRVIMNGEHSVVCSDCETVITESEWCSEYRYEDGGDRCYVFCICGECIGANEHGSGICSDCGHSPFGPGGGLVDGSGNVITSFSDLILSGKVVVDGTNLSKIDESLSGTLVVPSGITSIGDYEGGSEPTICTSNDLRVELPEGLTTIKTFTIAGCYSSKITLVVPTSLTTIESWAFHDTNTVTIEYKGTKEQWRAISIDTDCDGCYDTPVTVICTDGTIDNIIEFIVEGTTLTWINPNVTEFVVPDGITTIGANACTYSNSGLTITIPVSVTSIASGAFGDGSTIMEINYKGTVPQWYDISKGDAYYGEWFYVSCSDGYIYGGIPYNQWGADYYTGG